MNSSLYRGTVAHRRLVPFEHTFTYPICLAYLDLDELSGVFASSWLWGAERIAPVSFRRRDHVGDPAQPLAESVRSLVKDRTGRRPRGPIRLLTQPRYFGFHFNPASFYYCFGEDGCSLEQLVVEVTNTPWLERYCYVLELNEEGRTGCAKTFHVSPFMAMEHEYLWKISEPGERLRLDVHSLAAGSLQFSAALELVRVPVTAGSLRSAFVRSPLQSLRIVAAIYTQALRLWLRGAVFHPHPGRARRTGGATPS